MYVIQKQNQPKVIKIDRAEQFEDFLIPGFTWLVKAQPDLALVPASALVAIYNKCNPDNTIVKFESRQKAEQRTWPCILQMAGEEAPAEKASEPAAKPKKAPKEPKAKQEPKVKGERKPGIVKTFKDLARSPEGTTIPEAVAHLTTLFPNEPASMERTCRINLRPLYSPGEKWSKVKDEKRGWVYKLRVEK